MSHIPYTLVERYLSMQVQLQNSDKGFRLLLLNNWCKIVVDAKKSYVKINFAYLNSEEKVILLLPLLLWCWEQTQGPHMCGKHSVIEICLQP